VWLAVDILAFTFPAHYRCSLSLVKMASPAIQSLLLPANSFAGSAALLRRLSRRCAALVTPSSFSCHFRFSPSPFVSIFIYLRLYALHSFVFRSPSFSALLRSPHFSSPFPT